LVDSQVSWFEVLLKTEKEEMVEDEELKKRYI